MIPSLTTVFSLLLLAVGFGFVVFWHELGHFLAAKWAGVKVEQFAVGFGQAMLAWRKGLGLRIGTTAPEFKRRIKAHLTKTTGREFKDDEDELTEQEIAEGSKALGISETEYRLNWIPLGGYVKMMGQDDLRPNAEATDPRAYNQQTIGKRMVIVSAGVIMNIILAAIGFAILFMIGFNVPSSRVGSVVPGSPYQLAGGQVGDEIISVDGKRAEKDFTKVQLNVALAHPDAPIPVEIERIGDDGKPVRMTLKVQPRPGSGHTKDILGIGIGQAYALRTPDGKEVREQYEKSKEKLADLVDADLMKIGPGDVIKAVDGQSVEEAESGPSAIPPYVKFDRLLQASQGREVVLTVAGDGGKAAPREVRLRPQFMGPYGEQPLAFAGMLPRVQVSQIREGSPALADSKTKRPQLLRPGDVITSITTGKGSSTKLNPSFNEFRERVNAAGQSGSRIDVEFLRNGEEWFSTGLGTVKLNPTTYGLSIGISYEEGQAVVAETLDGSAARRANVPAGAKIVEVAGQAVTNWYDVYRHMTARLKDHPPAAAGADPAPIPVTYETTVGQRVAAALPLTAAEADVLRGYRFDVPVQFDQPRGASRQTDNPFTAVWMGVTETRDFVLQFYVTLRRMVTGDISPKNMMGPVGIFQAGTGFASKGTDWLIWFLAMISANLAVVNFLPIPIVDGGLFAFLIWEKIKGKPISPKVQAVAQYVGMALLLGVFLFVTYQDITWFMFRM